MFFLFLFISFTLGVYISFVNLGEVLCSDSVCTRPCLSTYDMYACSACFLLRYKYTLSLIHI